MEGLLTKLLGAKSGDQAMPHPNAAGLSGVIFPSGKMSDSFPGKHEARATGEGNISTVGDLKMTRSMERRSQSTLRRTAWKPTVDGLKSCKRFSIITKFIRSGSMSRSNEVKLMIIGPNCDHWACYSTLQQKPCLIYWKREETTKSGFNVIHPITLGLQSSEVINFDVINWHTFIHENQNQHKERQARIYN